MRSWLLSLSKIPQNPRLIFAVYMLIALVVFSLKLDNEFMWDDQRQIVSNPYVQSFDILELFSGSTFFSGGADGLSGAFYRPLMMVVYALIYQVVGLQVWGYHLVQILWHGANAFLLSRLLARFIAPKVAFMGALLFLVHPMTVEAVAYIANIQDVMFASFGLALLLSLDQFQTRKSLRSQWSSAFWLLLCLLVKESGIIFLVLSWLYVWLWRSEKLAQWLKQSVAIFAGYLLLRWSAVGGLHIASHYFPITAAPLSIRLLNIPKILWYYLSTFLWPQRLSVFQMWVVEQLSFQDVILPIILVLILLGGISFLAWKAVQHSAAALKPIIFCIAWIILVLGLHSQIIALDQTVADRWFYVGVIGSISLLSLLWHCLAPRVLSGVQVIVFALLVVGLSARTMARVDNWQSERALVIHDYPQDPTNYRLLNAVGYQLILDQKYHEAIPLVQESVERWPSWWNSWNNLGYAYEQVGEYSQASQAYTQALAHGNSYLTYANLTHVLLETGDTDQAEVIVSRGLSYYQNNPRLWYLLARVYQEQGKLIQARQAALSSQQIQSSPEVLELLEQLDGLR